MCGIVGLFLKNEALEPSLGSWMSKMLGTMCERGPDSAGFAIYSESDKGRVKLTVRAPSRDYDFAELGRAIGDEIGTNVPCITRGSHVVLFVPTEDEAKARAAIGARGDGIRLISTGTRMELYKEIGRPDAVALEFKLDDMRGSHAIAHTRMATESAVTNSGAHPFSTGTDQCLVHNGSLSNHNALRRDLARAGLKFETDNDTEVAANYLTYKMQSGVNLDEALRQSLSDLDGFYTFVVATEDGFGVLRDPIACKPAILAETDDYVAFGSEYRALAALPKIENAKVWEPEPATVYFWKR